MSDLTEMFVSVQEDAITDACKIECNAEIQLAGLNRMLDILQDAIEEKERRL